MPRWGLTAIIVAACLCIPVPGAAIAGVFGGKLEALDAQRGELRIAFLRRDATKEFRVDDSARITLDGKKATLDDLQLGQQVSVITSSSGMVLRIVARTPSALSEQKRAADDKPAADEFAPQPEPNSTRPALPAAHEATDTVDWPGFRGPNRDNISAESGLSDDWSQNPPRPLWMAEGLGEGYASVSLAKDMVFTMGTLGDREVVLAMDAGDSRGLWQSPTGGAVYKNGQGNGPRGTPTVDGERVYALGAFGDLICLEAQTGRAVWRKNILREFQARNIAWGISESVLIDGDRLICTPGGPGAAMVALDKNTGDVLWKAAAPGNPRAAYASAIVADVDGVRQYVNFVSAGVMGVRADDGEFLWGDESSANGTANCSTPIFERNFVFSASGYGAGGSLLKLTTLDNATKAGRVYHTDDMKNHHGGMVAVDGYLYGSSNPGILTCIELTSGKIAWKNRSVGKGSLAYADGHLYVRSENGPIALVEATPEGYREKGRIDQPNRSGRPAWAHPVVADGKLFLRDMDRLLVYDVRAR